MEAITQQQPFNLAVGLASREYFQRDFPISFTNFHEIFTIGL